MIRLSVAIMHTPAFQERRIHLEKMIDKISVSTIQQEVEDFKIFSDWYQKGVWYNARQCWMWGLSTKCTHHLVMQDDIELCEQFLKTAGLLHNIEPEFFRKGAGTWGGKPTW